jgi:hypothetical protein
MVEFAALLLALAAVWYRKVTAVAEPVAVGLIDMSGFELAELLAAQKLVAVAEGVHSLPVKTSVLLAVTLNTALALTVPLEESEYVTGTPEQRMFTYMSPIGFGMKFPTEPFVEVPKALVQAVVNEEFVTE